MTTTIIPVFVIARVCVSVLQFNKVFVKFMVLKVDVFITGTERRCTCR